MKKLGAIVLISAFATSAYATEQPSFSALDTDHDKAISQQEASGIPELIDQWQTLDTNADGKLDFEELAKFAAPEPQKGEAAK